MKKLIAAKVMILLTACSQELSAATPTPTPFVLPTVTTTPEPTATPIIVSPTPSPSPTPIKIDSYVVQPGDTLTSIANRFGVTVEFLAAINSIADPNVIYVGQILKLDGQIEIPDAPDAEGRQIVVKLSAQMVFAYENGQLIKTFIVSTGMRDYPTRLGEYKIWIKLEKTRMTGPGYDLPDVPWVMYFDEGRGFHGKYWNNIYGRPSSHGCVNMKIDEAKWLYDWAEVGDTVTVIP